MLATWRSCPHKFKLEYLEHWKPRTESVHLHAGKAFAEGLEAARRAHYEEGKSPADSLAEGIRALTLAYGSFECPPDSAKSLPRMLGALEFYFDRWPLGSDPAQPARIKDRLGIEFSFLEPLPITHPVTGDPLLWSGRADQVCEYAGGIFIEDDKTATQLGASWARQWNLRSQFTGYCWAAKNGAARIPVQGVLVRGVSILKTKYDSAEAITYRPDWMIERWFDQTMRDIRRIIEQWAWGHFDMNLDHACAEYGGCTFQQTCMAQDPLPFLETAFQRRKWDPITRTEMVMEAV